MRSPCLLRCLARLLLHGEELVASLGQVCPPPPRLAFCCSVGTYPNPISLSILTPDACTTAAQDGSCSVCPDCPLFSFARDGGRSERGTQPESWWALCRRSASAGRALQRALLSVVGPYDRQLPEILPGRLQKAGWVRTRSLLGQDFAFVVALWKCFGIKKT